MNRSKGHDPFVRIKDFKGFKFGNSHLEFGF